MPAVGPTFAGLAGRVALVTGANHGIGAATARLLATQGASVVLTYLRLPDAPAAGLPEAYRAARASDPSAVVAAVRAAGGCAAAIEADLSDPATAASLFDFPVR